ncbi:glycoside hydrolase family 15 protein [Thermanaeromonas toyohensis]|uniref:glycoside hydrolase family 15 protein n=1 Tax=Thermanaeromonas toyohensis TaxID=161154 RepID=UPI0009FE7A22|nr:glycoside hydrolase family 15 protein [Thermanaeromonas toyohensis]
MVIRASKDKASGAIVAGLGNPWGDTQGDSSNGGYHLVWARDLYKKASALLAAGDTVTPTEAVEWLFTKQQKSDGSFPQNSWVDGTPYWTGQQLDETAFPIMLAYKVGKTDATFYLNEIKPAADYLLKYAPYTGQERWEENAGYSPATIAAVVAGLVAAGKIADLNGYTADRDRYYERADYLQGLVANWTFTTSGPLGDGWYFERIDDWGDPNDGHTINIANGGGSWDERSIVDTSFTELVRHGVKPYNDPYIQQSFAETDGAIKQTIPGKGDYWFRYPHDGYGENADGSNYDGAGIGRLWPIFTGERGHYVIASGGDATPYLDAMRNAANSGYMIPEQVWDLNAPAGYTPGTPTKSMTPLGWSMAEYVTLAISKYYGKIADQLDIVRDRYVTYAFQPDPLKVIDWDPAKATQGKALTIYYNGSLKNSAQVIMHWGINNWAAGTIADKKMIKRSDGIWEVTISVPTNATQIDMAFTDGTNWDNNGGADYHITITARSYSPYITPVDMFPNPPVKGQPVTIYYKGFLASDPATRSITLHYGFDGWAAGTINDVAMSKRADGFWEVTLTMPTDRYKFDFCFVNNAGTWDNNGGADWHYGVTQK